MLTAFIMFYDGKGNFKKEEMSAKNMNQLVSMCDMLAEDLSSKWSAKAKWRKVNDPSDNTVTLKVKINNDYEENFKEYLNEKGFYYKKTVYAKNLNIWQVETPIEFEMENIKRLEYVLTVEDMPMIVAEF